MKKTLIAATAVAFAFTAPASAADLDNDIGLIVSGVVDQWAGVQFLDTSGFFGGDDTLFANGGEGRLSLPLGNNWSVQSDVKYEYNSYALENPFLNDVFGPRFSYQGAAHFSHRDPGSYLLGVFGGAGSADAGGLRTDTRFVGGEAQFYFDNITLYGQGGYVDFNSTNAIATFTLDDGFFARGVLRWFLADDSRIQLQGTYLKADYNIIGGDMEAFSVGARYDFNIGLPIVGDTPLYVGYRGTFRDNCTFFGDVDDHLIMIGTSYSFSGDRLTVDRRGATLDTPDFNYSCSQGTFF
ncbi:MAG: hypothetical protein WBD37_09730 [Anderseniella sp.]